MDDALDALAGLQLLQSADPSAADAQTWMHGCVRLQDALCAAAHARHSDADVAVLAARLCSVLASSRCASPSVQLHADDQRHRQLVQSVQQALGLAMAPGGAYDRICFGIRIADTLMGPQGAIDSKPLVDALVDVVAHCPFELARKQACDTLDRHHVELDSAVCRSLEAEAWQAMTHMRTVPRLQAASIWRLLSHCLVAQSASMDDMDSNGIDQLQWVPRTDGGLADCRGTGWIGLFLPRLQHQTRSAERGFLSSIRQDGPLHGTLEAIHAVMPAAMAYPTTVELAADLCSEALRAMAICEQWVLQHPSEHSALSNDDSDPQGADDDETHSISLVAYSCAWRGLTSAAAVLVDVLCSPVAKNAPGLDARWASSQRQLLAERISCSLISTRHWGVSQGLSTLLKTLVKCIASHGQIADLEILARRAYGLDPALVPLGSTDAGSDGREDATVRQDERYDGRSRVVVAVLSALPPRQKRAAVSVLVDAFVDWTELSVDSKINAVSILCVLVKDKQLGQLLPIWTIIETTQTALHASQGFSWRSGLVLLFTSSLDRAVSLLAKTRGQSPAEPGIQRLFKRAITETRHALDQPPRARLEADLRLQTTLLLISQMGGLRNMPWDASKQDVSQQLSPLLARFAQSTKVAALRVLAAKSLACLTRPDDSGELLQLTLRQHKNEWMRQSRWNALHGLLAIFEAFAPDVHDHVSLETAQDLMALLLDHVHSAASLPAGHPSSPAGAWILACAARLLATGWKALIPPYAAEQLSRYSLPSEIKALPA